MSSIDEYLDKHATAPQRTILEGIRKIANQLVPDGEETISYGIPTIKYKGKYVIYFAAFKDHMSVYPGPRNNEALQKKLEKFKVSKGTLHFTEKNPIPESLIKELVKNRLAELTKN